ncbi:MAG: hypothetical protein Q8R25_00180 [bacterium]|nr:hypothetical protein [bacterium]
MRAFGSFLLAAFTFIIPAVASAHAFGQQFTLPLPFSLYANGAAVALIASFVFLGLYSNPVPADAPYIVRRIPFSTRALVFLGASIGISAFIGMLALILFGSPDFFQNPAPILFWIILMLGVTYASVLIGGIWRLLNPFEHIVRLFFSRRQSLMQFPLKFRYVPALILYFVLVWLELLSFGGGAMPWAIGVILLSYLFISFIGALVFGVDDWFEYGDMFNTFFGVIGYFAPVQIDRDGIEIMPPGERLVEKSVATMPLLIFILFVLSSTAFDGLSETQIWWSVMYHSALQMNFFTLERTIVLALSPFIFFALYAGAIYFMKVFARSSLHYRELALRFGYSLVPIAIAYSFAHYFMVLVNETQTLIGNISDPFAMGWNLFGTVGYAPDIALIGAKTVWYIQLSTIVIGHIIATYIAHRIALRVFHSRTQIILGQLPILILMVFYTVFGLWILSQGYQDGV